jgi:RNA polymerase sigma-70 factor, ECF subfamily
MDVSSDVDLLHSDFGRFYDRHLGVVAAYVGRRVREPEVGFDLVAETFARALEKRHQYDPARGPAVAWLIGITRHLITDSVRRGQVEADSRLRLGMDPVQLRDEQLPIIARRASTELRDALAALPPEQREAVLRRVVLEEPYTEIAAGLRCSPQVVRKRVSRGLAALRVNLEGGPR